jgi:hypothetical protein
MVGCAMWHKREDDLDDLPFKFEYRNTEISVPTSGSVKSNPGRKLKKTEDDITDSELPTTYDKNRKFPWLKRLPSGLWSQVVFMIHHPSFPYEPMDVLESFFYLIPMRARLEKGETA